MPAMAVAIASFASRPAASGVRVSDGAIAFTRTFGESSAASEVTSPSIAPFAIPTDTCDGKPCRTAMLENSSTDAVPRARFSCASAACTVSTAPTACSRKSSSSCASVIRCSGASRRLPTA